jgi:hypothetical protein
MGVSQAQSVVDVLASSTSASKRNQSNANQAMFDIALKSASIATPQASGNETLKKQDVASAADKAKGKEVPHNGKEVPEKSDNAKTATVAHQDSRDAVYNAQAEDDSNQAAEDNERDLALVDKNAMQAAADKAALAANEAEEELEAAALADADALALDQEEVDLALEQKEALTAETLNDLLTQMESGELSAEDFLGKLEQVLESQDLDISDIQDFVVSEGLVSEEEFNELLADPADFITQLQQWFTPDSELAATLKDLGASADVIARLGAALQSRLSNQNETYRFVDVLKSENNSRQADDLVSSLLKEQGSAKDQDSLFDRDKLFEQLMAQKNPDTAGKVSGFAGLMLKEGVQGGFSQAGTLGSTVVGSGSETLQAQGLRPGVQVQTQTLPQLPVLRGLPGQAGATEALNERIMMMRSKGIQTAEIRLDPPDLGSLEIRVRVSGDTTTIQFHSPNPSVREALESQVNKLREMMEGAGVDLGQVDVSDQSLSERKDDEYAFGESPRSSDGASDEDPESDSVAERRIQSQSAIGVVDYFA